MNMMKKMYTNISGQNTQERVAKVENSQKTEDDAEHGLSNTSDGEFKEYFSIM